MPYKYSDSRPSSRRSRRFWARFNAWTQRGAWLAIISAVLLAIGMVIVMRRQAEDMPVGVAVSALGAWGLLWVSFTNLPATKKTRHRSDSDDEVTAEANTEKLDKLEQTITLLRKDLARNEVLLCSLLDVPVPSLSENTQMRIEA